MKRHFHTARQRGSGQGERAEGNEGGRIPGAIFESSFPGGGVRRAVCSSKLTKRSVIAPLL
jgi:hypothetical protein